VSTQIFPKPFGPPTTFFLEEYEYDDDEVNAKYRYWSNVIKVVKTNFYK